MPANTDVGFVCWVCQFADCDERPEDPLLPTGCACCREGSSSGWAHVSCLASAAAHKESLWNVCPTCKQRFTGAVEMGLSSAHWELCRYRPEEDITRLAALDELAIAFENSGDLAAARPLFEEMVAVCRRTLGDVDYYTLQSISNLGSTLSKMGDLTEAQLLLEEAVAGLRLTVGDENESTLLCSGSGLPVDSALQIGRNRQGSAA